ncbi:MAG TPA: FtsX-like permease family protein, partial [Blastocatellia bacterium]|nr:FtsX-like permease family protein [Blastocatellia bacterium]
IGRKIILDGRPYTVAGVLPADHRTVTGFGFSPDLYLPVSGEEASVTLYARLPEGMTRQVAHDRLKSVCEDLDRQYPHTQENWASGIRISSVSGIDRFDSDDFIAIAAFFAVLMIVVWLVLLIACANVAGLLLARGANRAHEFAVRMSLGARRGRIIRQLLTETFLLALCGTVAGLILNLALSSALSNFQLPLPLPLQLTIKPDFRLLAYAITVSIVCTLVAGLIPAFKSTRWGINASLKQGERQVGRTNLVLRNTLVVGQIVVSVVLLSAGLVFTRNLLRASTMDPGFDTERTIWSSVRLVPENYPKAEKRTVLISQVLDRLRTLPGIESASIARVVPLNGHLTTGTGMRTDLNSNVAHVTFNENYVGDGYFKTLGIRVLLGREFLPSDRRGSPRVAILNENLATKLFGSTDPTGHAIYFEKEDPILIVGVVRNSKYFTLGEENAFAFYQPYAQWEGSEELQFLVRVAGNPDNYSTIITKAIGDMDSSAAIETKPMNRALVFALLPSRVGAAILGSVGLLALALVAIGLYGILSYSVSGRRQEIGLRVVLGAKPASILWLVVRQGLVLVITGIVIGVALSMALLPPLSAFLISGVRPTDYTNFVVTGIVLCVVAMIATVMPATRALLVDPAIALRSE